MLNGLKTAFFTSLAGMIGSVILSWFLNKTQDKKDGGVSDINQAAGTICQAVQQMSTLNAEAIDAVKQQIAEQERDRKAFYRSMGDVMDNVKASQALIATTLSEIKSAQLSTSSALDTLVILERSEVSSIEKIGTSLQNIDNKVNDVVNITSNIGVVCQAVQQMSEHNKQTVERLSIQIEEHEKDTKLFYSSMGDVMDNVKVSQSLITSTLSEIKTAQLSSSAALDTLVILERDQVGTLAGIKNSSDLLIGAISELEKNTSAQTEFIKDVQKTSKETAEYTQHLPEILDVLSGMSGTQDTISEQVLKLKDILDAEVDQIERSMDKTNELLERKFDEFTELLKKSNTEALVEVMKKVTEEFQKQMNSLINKLIQENFDQLNKSVERLNQWQQENKEMITSLTRQYKEMANNFEATSTSLDRVKDDTQSLVSEGGKLRKIVDSLNEVIVQDEKFIKTAEHLQKTAELSQSNMEAFNQSTKSLNEWVRKQRNFVDGVQMLIEKLEEIGKIKDYNEQFWAGTKRSLEDGVGILNKSAQSLKSSLTDIDRQFYNRLNTTLAELDTCIQAMIKGK